MRSAQRVSSSDSAQTSLRQVTVVQTVQRRLAFNLPLEQLTPRATIWPGSRTDIDL